MTPFRVRPSIASDSDPEAGRQPRAITKEHNHAEARSPQAGRSPRTEPQPRAVREQQQAYEGFIRQLDGNVGELELAPSENIRAVKVSLRRAGTRLGSALEIWDANDRVYFKAANRRGRPRKSS